MTLTTLAWLAMSAYSLHILEEYNFDWRNWARNALNLPVEWTDFYITNAIVVALGIAQAELAPTLPLAPLSFAALMVINALFFHILPWIRMKGRFFAGTLYSDHSFPPDRNSIIPRGTFFRRSGLENDDGRFYHRCDHHGLSDRHAEIKVADLFPADDPNVVSAKNFSGLEPIEIGTSIRFTVARVT